MQAHVFDWHGEKQVGRLVIVVRQPIAIEDQIVLVA
jgi:hypothetical protein